MCQFYCYFVPDWKNFNPHFLRKQVSLPGIVQFFPGALQSKATGKGEKEKSEINPAEKGEYSELAPGRRWIPMGGSRSQRKGETVAVDNLFLRCYSFYMSACRLSRGKKRREAF